MAKKKKGKVVQMLSPEKYIRQKARTLPIHECRINSDWEENGMAHITVARKHSNGNITLGMYLTDLKCLGVKDAHYFFNISEHEYRQMLDDTEERMDTEPVSYTLAHNIVFAGVEFAGDYGFKPHKDFNSVAQYILEEDTDDIELIEIECGKDGKPLYMSGPFDSDTRAREIIAQLERTAGPGNYDFIHATGEDSFDDDIRDDDDRDYAWLEEDIDEQQEKFRDFSTDEKVDLIAEMVHPSKELSHREKEDLSYLINTTINEKLDFDKVHEIYDDLVVDLLEFEITGELSDELLGTGPDSDINREKWGEQFLEIYDLTVEDPEAAEKKLKKLQKKMPENSALCFLELLTLQIQDLSGYAEKLDKYYNRYPQYALIKMLWVTASQRQNKSARPEDLFKKGPEEFFPGRESLHEIEMFQYLLMLIITATAYHNLILIEVVDWLIEEIEIPEGNYLVISDFIAVARVNSILNRINQKI